MKNTHSIDRKLLFFEGEIFSALRFTRAKFPAKDASDEELALKAASGSINHFEALVRRYSAAMYRVAYRLSGSPSEAEDITQETFIKLFRALPRARLDLPFKPWLYKIAVNTAISHLRKSRGGPKVGWETAEIAQSSNLAESVVTYLDAQAAVNSLPLGYRQVTILRAVEGLSFAEIAQILDIPQATARTKFHRAKILLKTYLSK